MDSSDISIVSPSRTPFMTDGNRQPGPPGRYHSRTSGIFLYLGFSVRELVSASRKPTCWNRQGIQETFAQICEYDGVIFARKPFGESKSEPLLRDL